MAEMSRDPDPSCGASARIAARKCWKGKSQSYAEARRLYELAAARGDLDAASDIVELEKELERDCPLLGLRVVITATITKGFKGERGLAVDFAFSEQHGPDGKATHYDGGRYARYYVKYRGLLRKLQWTPFLRLSVLRR